MSGITTIFILSGMLVLFSSFVNGTFTFDDVVSRRIKSRRIAFEAHLSSRNGRIPAHTTIVFPVCTLNEGNGYNGKDGKFTAPVPGVYKFGVHICHARGKHMVAAIMKGKVQLAVTTAFENSQTGSGCGFVDTLVRLKKGDVVNVEAKWTDSNIQADLFRWNSFSGHLVYA